MRGIEISYEIESHEGEREKLIWETNIAKEMFFEMDRINGRTEGDRSCTGDGKTEK